MIYSRMIVKKSLSTESFSTESFLEEIPPVCVLRTGRRRRDTATGWVLQINS